MNRDLHTVAEWREACHLYFSLVREFLHHTQAGRLVLSDWISRGSARDMSDLLKAAADAVERAPFPFHPEGDA